MHPPRIVVVGSAVIDLTTFTNRFPRPGETVLGEQFDLGFGGKGANQAVAARLCGADVQMVARVGNDLFGPATIQNFAARGIEASHVRIVDGVSSGVAPILVDDTGQNRIIVVKGANDRLRPEDVDLAEPLLRDASYVLLQLEIPLETVYHTIRLARTTGAGTILNPAPGQPLDLKAVGPVDYLIPNESEAEAISGQPVRTPDEARDCARRLIDQGVRRVIITLGAGGSLLASRDATEHIPTFRVESRDTTGAGDAFIGSLAVFLAEGVAERESVERASLYAALSTTRVGTQKSFSTRAEFEDAWRDRKRAARL
jgi:ribokinase